MKRALIAFFLFSCTVYGQTAKIAATPRFGKFDPREYEPTSTFTNLVLWLPCSWDLGTNAADCSYSRNDAYATDATTAPTWVTNGAGALSFGGVDDYIELGTPASLSIADSFTWAFWCLPATNLITQAQVCFGSNVTASSAMGATVYVRVNSPWVQATMSGAVSGTNVGVGCTNNPRGSWHHLAVTWDESSATWSLYYDAVLQGSTINTNLHDVTPTTSMTIGRAWLPTAYYANGIIDEFHQYDRALSGSEITDLRARTLRGHP